MPSPIVALAGASIGGAAIQYKSADKAADASSAATTSANALQKYIFDMGREDREPYLKTGTNALDILKSELGMGAAPSFGPRGNRITMDQGPGGKYRITNSFGDVTQRFDQRSDARNYMKNHQAGFETSPGFEFAQDQGINAIEHMASARGNRLGGATLKEAGRFATGLAQQDYGNYINRLAGLSGTGQSAVAQGSQAGQQYAGSVGQNLTNDARVRGSSYQGQANAIGGGINSLGSLYGAAQGGYFGANPGLGIQPYPSALKNFGY